MRCALYIDHVITPIFETTDDQLREVYRTAAHPFRQIPYETTQKQLAQWYLSEKVLSAETSFFQSARSRITIVQIP